MVSVPRDLVLICARTFYFETTQESRDMLNRIGWQRRCVGWEGGGGGERQVVCHSIAVAQFHAYINLQLQISDETMVSVGSKACNESIDRKWIFCYLCYCKIILLV